MARKKTHVSKNAVPAGITNSPYSESLGRSINDEILSFLQELGEPSIDETSGVKDFEIPSSYDPVVREQAEAIFEALRRAEDASDANKCSIAAVNDQTCRVSEIDSHSSAYHDTSEPAQELVERYHRRESLICENEPILQDRGCLMEGVGVEPLCVASVEVAEDHRMEREIGEDDRVDNSDAKRFDAMDIDNAAASDSEAASRINIYETSSESVVTMHSPSVTSSFDVAPSLGSASLPNTASDFRDGALSPISPRRSSDAVISAQSHQTVGSTRCICYAGGNVSRAFPGRVSGELTSRDTVVYIVSPSCSHVRDNAALNAALQFSEAIGRCILMVSMDHLCTAIGTLLILRIIIFVRRAVRRRF